MKYTLTIISVLLIFINSHAQTRSENQKVGSKKTALIHNDNSSISTVEDLESEMVMVTGGSFKMGSNDGMNDEKPMHNVTVSSFKMSKYEITIKEFALFVNTTGYKTEAEKVGYSYIYTGDFEKANNVSWKDDEVGQKRSESEWNKPVIHVSWNDAVAYCQWLSKKTGKTFRLPTEAEWEYAAGNGAKHTKFSWGNNLPGTDDKVGNVADETVDKKYGSHKKKFQCYKDGCFFSAPVGSYDANEFGLYDMTGNVWEWCSDWYNKKYYEASPTNNPKGPEKGESRVYRGGSWFYDVSISRVAYRSHSNPMLSNYNIGFRVVCLP